MTKKKREKLQWILDNPAWGTGEMHQMSFRTERGVHFMYSPEELQFLLSLITKPPEGYDNLWIVEIGTGKAGTTAQMAAYQALKGFNLKVMTCAPTHKVEIEKELEPVKDYVTYYRLWDYLAIKCWQKKNPGARIWFLFLDNGHNYESVINELWAYASLVIPGGTIFVHDTRAGKLFGDGEINAMYDFCTWNPEFKIVDTKFESNKLIRRIG